MSDCFEWKTARMVKQITKLCDWKASSAFYVALAQIWMSANTQMYMCACVHMCTFLPKADVDMLLNERFGMYVCMQHRPWPWRQMSLCSVKEWIPKMLGFAILWAINHLEVFTEISHRTSGTSRSITREEFYLSCFVLNSNWPPQQEGFHIWFQSISSSTQVSSPPF